eukprot:CAMPEP_0185255058 /NCGR_PEP_ID=MMETSP1359-20130426/4030_1 /TAXON_ID=552665 /ORGANISM="Bigelowiella longifila, Strain CCMP242" /LENGTH=273 /DNA_ID=CAMNT_0027838653 /DNA_START=60 /DNA_END=881 /DNA_ORIENTATION=-
MKTSMARTMLALLTLTVVLAVESSAGSSVPRSRRCTQAPLLRKNSGPRRLVNARSSIFQKAYNDYKSGEINVDEFRKIGIKNAKSKLDKEKEQADKFRNKFGKAMAEGMGIPLERILIEKIEPENPKDDIEKLLAGNGKGIKVDFAIKQNPGDPTASTMLMAAQGGPGAGKEFNVAEMLRLTPEQESSFAEVYERMKNQGVMMANALDFDGLTRVCGSIEPKLSPDQQAILVNMGLQINAMQPEKPYFDTDDDPTIPSDPAEEEFARNKLFGR